MHTEAQPSSQSALQWERDKAHETPSEGPATELSSEPISSGDTRKVSCEDIQLVSCGAKFDRKVSTAIHESRRSNKNSLEPSKNRARLHKSCVAEVRRTESRLFQSLLHYAEVKETDHTVQSFARTAVSAYYEVADAIKSLYGSFAKWHASSPYAVPHLPMGYPVLQQPPLPAPGHHHIVPMTCGPSSTHVVNGAPSQENLQSFQRSPGTDNMADISMEVPPDMSLSPASVMSSGPFPFNPTDMFSIGINLMSLDAPFSSGDIGGSNGIGTLQVPPDAGGGSLRDSVRSLGSLPWNFSLSDLTADLTNGGDLGSLGSYSGSPFLPPDTEVSLESPDKDDIDEEFFIDSITQPSYESDEDKEG